MDKATLEQLLARHLDRVQVRPGNGLTRSMNHSLRTYPMIPDIIIRVAKLLVQTEQLMGAPVQMKRVEAFGHLLAVEADWGRDVPLAGGQIGFERVPNKAKVSLPAFHCAMTIARRIGLIAGHGRFGLAQDIRNLLRTAAQHAA